MKSKSILILIMMLFILTSTIFADISTSLNTNENLIDLKNSLNKPEQSIFPKDNEYDWNTVSEWKTAREQFKHDLKIYDIYCQNKESYTVNCLKSIIAPGWGHFSAKSYTKGEILLGLQMFLAGSSFYFYDKSMDSYDNYKNATNIQDISQYYTDANASYQTSQLFLSFWVLVWGYTIIDSFQATENYNRDLWGNLVIKYQGKKISLTPNGINIRF
ncbi:MAG: hypothetical protein U9P79_08655 [Candidatus Cloacimonadota bacterium]|nr:hypothetical protein [Candidatus Cloacimonadota bacterium]